MKLGDVLKVIVDSQRNGKPIKMSLSCGDSLVLDPELVDLSLVCGGQALKVHNRNGYRKQPKSYKFEDIQSLNLI